MTTLSKTLTLLALTGLVACGEADAPESATKKSFIVGGEIENGYAAVGALVADGEFFCTGTLVRQDIVVTAAHCLEELQRPEQVQFFLGTDATNLGSGSLLPVSAFRMHPDYPRDEDADIGIMRLGRAAEVQPIPLNQAALANEVIGQKATFVGYGAVGYKGESDEAGLKRSVEVTVREINPKAFRYSDPDKGTCHGDSGGPAFIDIAGQQRLIGVTSWGDDNCEEFGVNTRTDAYIQFLRAFMEGEAPAEQPEQPEQPEAGEGEGEEGLEDEGDWEDEEGFEDESELGEGDEEGHDEENCEDDEEGYDEEGFEDEGEWEDEEGFEGEDEGEWEDEEGFEGEDEGEWEDEEGYEDDPCGEAVDACLEGAESDEDAEACFAEADACYGE